jgi:hypothetical protein
VVFKTLAARSIIPSRTTHEVRKGILLTIAVGVLLDILIDVLIPDHVVNLVFLIMMSVLLIGVLLVAFGTLTKNHWGSPSPASLAVHRSRKCGDRNH